MDANKFYRVDIVFPLLVHNNLIFYLEALPSLSLCDISHLFVNKSIPVVESVLKVMFEILCQTKISFMLAYTQANHNEEIV